MLSCDTNCVSLIKLWRLRQVVSSPQYVGPTEHLLRATPKVTTS